jgi:hypothetical protein
VGILKKCRECLPLFFEEERQLKSGFRVLSLQISAGIHLNPADGFATGGASREGFAVCKHFRGGMTATGGPIKAFHVADFKTHHRYMLEPSGHCHLIFSWIPSLFCQNPA